VKKDILAVLREAASRGDIVLVLNGHGMPKGFVLSGTKYRPNYHLEPSDLTDICEEYPECRVLIVADTCDGAVWIKTENVKNLCVIATRDYGFWWSTEKAGIPAPSNVPDGSDFHRNLNYQGSFLMDLALECMPLDAGFADRLYEAWERIPWDRTPFIPADVSPRTVEAAKQSCALVMFGEIEHFQHFAAAFRAGAGAERYLLSKFDDNTCIPAADPDGSAKVPPQVTFTVRGFTARDTTLVERDGGAFLWASNIEILKREVSKGQNTVTFKTLMERDDDIDTDTYMLQGQALAERLRVHLAGRATAVDFAIVPQLDEEDDDS